MKTGWYVFTRDAIFNESRFGHLDTMRTAVQVLPTVVEDMADEDDSQTLPINLDVPVLPTFSTDTPLEPLNAITMAETRCSKCSITRTMIGQLWQTSFDAAKDHLHRLYSKQKAKAIIEHVIQDLVNLQVAEDIVTDDTSEILAEHDIPLIVALSIYS
ncbi:hypothetical protein E1B28_013470 [Marasmius oreades]|uniref:Uncharacterized protein n=1 Tax=Marasmius oreades TaxID=181124 RepID=A0A9P7RPM6_9AGAR|nr:uncharacterized protein E1B28_013470 [Marasmius oreades]KAG7087509.1 hypothetical protein E1B28_013470 [Marasmius oreades]